jgi:cytoskeletal protein CcmA (bactofilin family)
MTTIGASLSITGEVSSNEDVTIHGQVNGKITMHAGSLLVSPTGKVKAVAQVGQIRIQGAYSGDLAASQRVEMVNTAKVTGTIVGPAIVMQDGAVFNGMIEVNRDLKLAKPAVGA